MLLPQPLLEACGGRSLLTSLLHVNVGGEAVQPAAVAAMTMAAPKVQLYDVYGPTEASVVTTMFRCNDYATAESVPIGRCAVDVILMCVHSIALEGILQRLAGCM